MVKKIGSDGKRIGKVSEAEQTKEVKTTAAVSSVKKVKGAEAVSGTGAVGAVRARRPTRTMTIEERAKLFQMIDEEAEKLINQGGIPESKREVVRNAVKIAIDAGLVEEEKDKRK